MSALPPDSGRIAALPRTVETGQKLTGFVPRVRSALEPNCRRCPRADEHGSLRPVTAQDKSRQSEGGNCPARREGR
jgi:hypothetical protein